MGDEIETTLDSQFVGFAKLFDHHRSGGTITLYRSDYWMRQAKLLDDRKLTMTDTGIAFNKFSKTELDWDEWNEFLSGLHEAVGLDEEVVNDSLTNCGSPDTIYCETSFDSFLCWPPTPAGEKPTQHCPEGRLSDPRELASRHCGEDGIWAGKNENDTIAWTNFSSCFPREAQKLLDKVHGEGVYEVANNTRYMEIVGFSFSLIALAVSFFIFCHYRALRNNRTRIHKNLFGAMLVQVVIRLIIYADQAIVMRVSPQNWYTGIEKVPFLCKSLYVLLEYAITVVFMWMFIEGMYLYNVVTANALRTQVSYPLYYAIGWGLPIFLTGIWVIPTAVHYQDDTTASCWFGYNFGSLYWILQAPRIAVIVANFIFLYNILRDLIIKLRDNVNNEMQIVKKAARAALVLLPLLGLTNVLNMIDAPLDSGYWKLALWSYSTHFPRSFQGFFIALIYCFLNHEVRTVVYKHYRNWREMRADDARRQRDSIYRSFRCGTEAGESNRKEWAGRLVGQWRSRTSADSPLPSLHQQSQQPAQPPADRGIPHHEESTAVAEVNLNQDELETQERRVVPAERF